MKLKKLFVLLLLLVFFSKGFAETKEDRVRRIFDRIVQQVDDGGVKPIFVFSKTGDKRAVWINLDGKIYFEEWLYDFFRERFPDTYTDVMSYIIGHEIAHFYKHVRNHDYEEAHGIAYSKSYQKIEGKKAYLSIEREADIVGGMYSYMAGYDIRKVSGSFMRPLYDTLAVLLSNFKTVEEMNASLVADSRHYFPLTERDSIQNIVVDSLGKLIGIYEAGNMLYFSGNYEDAAQCYEYILYFYPSKEIYNNLGICYAEMALKEADKELKVYKFPFTFDLETKISDYVSKGVTDNTIKARNAFQMAISRDNEYWEAYINLASVYVIENKTDSTHLVLSQINASKADKYLIADMNIVKGIAFAIQGDKDEAKDCFKKAKKGNKIYANINLDALDGKYQKKSKLVDNPDIMKEEVCGFNLNIRNYPRGDNWKFHGTNLNHKNEENSDKNMFFESDSCSIFFIDFNNSHYTILRNTKSNGKTLSGVGIGDDFDLIKMKKYYGKNYLISQDKESYFYSFNYIRNGIVFMVRKTDNLINGCYLIKR